MPKPVNSGSKRYAKLQTVISYLYEKKLLYPQLGIYIFNACWTLTWTVFARFHNVHILVPCEWSIEQWHISHCAVRGHRRQLQYCYCCCCCCCPRRFITVIAFRSQKNGIFWTIVCLLGCSHVHFGAWVYGSYSMQSLGTSFVYVITTTVLCAFVAHDCHANRNSVSPMHSMKYYLIGSYCLGDSEWF